MSKLRRPDRCAFTLVEAMVSTAITAVAGSAVLLGIASTVATTEDMLQRAQAGGIAQQVMDEIAGQLYCEDPTNPFQYPFTANAYELAGSGRERYNDIDDYFGFAAQPVKDRWGFMLGTENGRGSTRDPKFCVNSGYFTRWQQTVSVNYVNPANQSQALGAGQTSQYRAVEVKINFQDTSQGVRPLATLRRVFTYVPIQ